MEEEEEEDAAASGVVVARLCRLENTTLGIVTSLVRADDFKEFSDP